MTSTEPALPEPVADVAMVRELGGELISWRVQEGDAAAGLLVRELGLPREALVHLIVRDGRAVAPRGSTRVEPGDELHLLVQERRRGEVERLTRRWREGPLGEPAPLLLPLRGAPQVFSVRPGSALGDDPADPKRIDGIEVRARLRSRRDEPGALVALADGRFAVTGERHLAIGARRALAELVRPTAPPARSARPSALVAGGDRSSWCRWCARGPRVDPTGAAARRSSSCSSASVSPIATRTSPSQEHGLAGGAGLDGPSARRRATTSAPARTSSSVRRWRRSRR